MKNLIKEFNQMDKGERFGVVGSVFVAALAFGSGVFFLAGHLGFVPAIGAVSLVSWVLVTM
jgi:hypothetical protein